MLLPADYTRPNFELIRKASLPLLKTFCQHWLPKGRQVGDEYYAINPTRADRRTGSFKVKVLGPKAGVWSDFATGDGGGDVISLAAYLFNLSQTEAARRLAEMLELPHE